MNGKLTLWFVELPLPGLGELDARQTASAAWALAKLRWRDGAMLRDLQRKVVELQWELQPQARRVNFSTGYLPWMQKIQNCMTYHAISCHIMPCHIITRIDLTIRGSPAGGCQHVVSLRDAQCGNRWTDVGHDQCHLAMSGWDTNGSHQ